MSANGGSPLSVFIDLMNATGPMIFSGSDDLVNEATQRSYTLGRFLIDDEMGELVQGGDRIQDFLMKDDASTYVDYLPGAMHTFQQPQVLKDWFVDWRFSLDHMAWNQQDVLLQMGQGLTRKARSQKYKSIKKKLEMRVWTSLINGMERALWAAPDADEMEDQDGRKPYSLPAFNNEETNGLFVEDGGSVWTTVMGINPVTDPYWVPQQVQYNFNDPFDTNKNKDGIIDAFEHMCLLLDFDPLPKMPEHAEPRVRDKWIVTSNGGLLWYKRALRETGDRGYVSNPQDPAYMTPRFAGYAIERSEQLETANLYDDGSSGRTTWDSATTPGPRFYFFMTKYLRMIFHSERYFHTHKVDSHPNQIGTYRQPIEVWRNLVCRSRRRGCGIVYPGGAGSA